MSGTTNLNLIYVQAAQNLKEVTLSEMMDRVDDVLTETLAISVSGGNATPTAAQIRECFLVLISGATVAGRTVTLPVMKKPTFFRLDPASTKSVSIVRGTTSYVLYPGAVLRLMTDGTTNGMYRLSEHGPDRREVQVRGAPSASEVFLRTQIQEASVLLPDALGCDAEADVAATGSTVFEIRKNGVAVGTITWAAAGTVPTFATTSGAAQSFATGDYFDIAAPASADATLSDIFFHIMLVRS